MNKLIFIIIFFSIIFFSIGLSVGVYKFFPYYEIDEIKRIILSEDTSNKKYSQHLIEETIKEANKVNKDLKTITLAVSEENIPAIKLYSKNNFVEFENKSKFRLKSTKEHKFVYMKLDL